MTDVKLETEIFDPTRMLTAFSEHLAERYSRIVDIDLDHLAEIYERGGVDAYINALDEITANFPTIDWRKEMRRWLGESMVLFKHDFNRPMIRHLRKIQKDGPITVASSFSDEMLEIIIEHAGGLHL